MKVNSSSKINKYRNHNSVVNRMTSSSASSAVTPVDRVEPVQNNPALLSYNSLMASDQFYDNLADLRTEYKKFYHDQRELEKALEDMDEDKECLCENLRQLVEKYNIALSSLKMFDQQFGTRYRLDVEELLRKFKRNLSEVGVTINENATLAFEVDKFRESIIDSNDALKFLFRPIRGLIIKLHRAFTNIKIPENDDIQYYEHEGRVYNGMITDERI